MATGEYFKWAAHDDICRPEYLERCVRVHDCDPRIVVARARVGSRNGPTEVEAGSTAETQRGVLEAFGHRVQTMPMTSGLNLIVREGDAWVGAADPRREGVAAGF